jgi:hypothetical protein
MVGACTGRGRAHFIRYLTQRVPRKCVPTASTVPTFLREIVHHLCVTLGADSLSHSDRVREGAKRCDHQALRRKEASPFGASSHGNQIKDISGVRAFLHSSVTRQFNRTRDALTLRFVPSWTLTG